MDEYALAVFTKKFDHALFSDRARSEFVVMRYVGKEFGVEVGSSVKVKRLRSVLNSPYLSAWRNHVICTSTIKTPSTVDRRHLQISR
jgi:hypothetical protein